MKVSKDKLYFSIPVLLGFLIFISNFLNTSLFEFELLSFAVWFVLSTFVFACGWIINLTLGWVQGGKLVFAVIVAAALISIIIVSLFSNYFGVNELLTESLLLYSLRNIFLGAMGLFGMTVAELLNIQKQLETETGKNLDYEKKALIASKEAEMLIKEAELKAEKILFEAEKKSVDLKDKIEKIERQLREFIQAEKELISRYKEEND